MKKLLSLGLATTLALGMAIPTFAWGGGGTDTPTTPTQSQAPSGGGSTQPSQAPSGGLEDGKVSATISGTTVGKDTSTIDLSLPTNLNGSIVLNPYGLYYTDGNSTPSQNTVITSGYKYIKNTGANDLNVVWEVTGSASEGVTLEKKTPDQWTSTQAKAKSVHLPVMIGQTTNDTSAPPAADTKNATSNPVYVTTDTQTNAATSSSQAKLTVAKNNYLGYGIKTAAPATSAPNWWDSAAKGAWVSNGEYIASGASTVTEVDMDSPWTSDDWVNVSFVFTFEVA